MGILGNLRWPLVALSLAVSLALLAGGGAAVRHFRVDNPLRTALAADPAVVSYTLADDGGVSVLRVRLGDVPDLAVAWRRLDAVAARTLGAGHYRIELADRRTPALNEAYHRIHYALEEGLQRGTYDEMARRVAAETAGIGLSRQRVTVDGGRIYVQLHQGQDYLYAVLSQQPVRGGEGS